MKASVLLLLAMLGGASSSTHLIRVSGTVEMLRAEAGAKPGYEIRLDRPMNISGRQVKNIEICRGGQCLKLLLNKRVTATGKIEGKGGSQKDSPRLILIADPREQKAR